MRGIMGAYRTSSPQSAAAGNVRTSCDTVLSVVYVSTVDGCHRTVL